MLKKILIIDPYQDRVFSLQNILENEGYEVYFAFNNEEAISRLSVDDIYLIIYRSPSDIDNLVNLLNWIETQNRLICVSILVIPDQESELFELIEKFEQRINKDVFFITDLDELKENVGLLLNPSYFKERLLNEKSDAESFLNEIKSEEKKWLSDLRKEKREIYKNRLAEMKSFTRVPEMGDELKKEYAKDSKEMDIYYSNLIKSVNLEIKNTVSLYREKKRLASKKIKFIYRKLKELKGEKIHS